MIGSLAGRLAGTAAIVAAALAFLLPPAAAFAGDDEDPNEACTVCHEDPALLGEKKGKKISVHVDPAKLKASVHAKIPCTDCHEDLEGSDGPHKPDADLVDCGKCHDKEATAHAASLHGQAHARGDEMAPTCVDCHSNHDVKRPADPTSPTNHMNIPLLCGTCHHEGSPVSKSHDIPQDRILENYSEGMHGEGLFKKGLSVTAVCTSCHTSHEIRPHDDPKSSINRDNIVATCMQCHAQIERVHRKVIDGKLWEAEPHKVPVCVECHAPHKVRRVFYPAGVASKDCLTSGCHGKPDLTMQRDGKTVSLFVDEAKYGLSAHTNTGCAQCHSEVDPSHDVRPCDAVTKKVDCSACHAETVGNYQASIHGQLHAKGDPDAPACLDCHDKHATKSKKTSDSPTFSRNVPVLCGRCHQEGKKAAVRIHTGVADIVGSYNESIHGKGLTESGLLVTATCVSCHSSHRELPPTDPASTVHPANLAATCGQCHAGIEETLRASVHSPSVTTTDKKLPTCNDCHTSHNISRADRADFRFRVAGACGDCHVEQSESYKDTFHGKVTALGSSAAAKCYDCHGTHDVLPSVNPKSHLSRENVVATCGKCHEGSHRRFAGYLTHATHHDPDTYPWLFWSFWGMTALLIGTLSFALIHTFAWLARLWLTREQWRPHRAAFLAAEHAEGAKLYRRFNRYQRMQHLIMMISFFTLALTGMTLKFSYAGWADTVAAGFGGHGSMRTLHRIAAVLLTGVFVAHLISVNRLRKESGRSWWRMVFSPDSLMFNRKDWEDFVGSMKWFFGLGERPRYARWTYWEKFDYFAVFWGVFIIGGTGLILWFPEEATYVVPGWVVNVATIIHSDEALLAVAFIFTIHFFNTHFRPDKFPMDPVIFTGRVTVEELKYERPEEYEAMVKSGKLDEHMVTAFPKPVERGFRVFGFVAVAIGLTLIGLIIYAMLFQYQ